MSAHSIIAPSSASRWGACPGSAVLEAGYPDNPEHEESRKEGNASHWVASSVLTDGARPQDFVGLTAFNGIIIDDVMVDAAMVYVAAVLAVSGEVLKVEQAVQIARINAACFGTPDSWYYDAVQGILHIFDYKYGWGVVEAFENKQGVCYYAGIIDELGIPDEHLRVHIHIIQPRPYHWGGPVRTWETTRIACNINSFHTFNFTMLIRFN